jgi:hypothetical protein
MKIALYVLALAGNVLWGAVAFSGRPVTPSALSVAVPPTLTTMAAVVLAGRLATEGTDVPRKTPEQRVEEGARAGRSGPGR